MVPLYQVPSIGNDCSAGNGYLTPGLSLRRTGRPGVRIPQIIL